MMVEKRNKAPKGSFLNKAGLATLTFLFLCALAPASHAFESYQSKNVKTLKYEWDRTTPAYKMAWAAMMDIYKDTPYDNTQTYFDEPVMYYAQIDLNGDGKKEIIAYPTEEMHEEGSFCIENTTKCPHYVIKDNDGKPLLIGKIYANSVDVGKNTANGFKALKAFTMEDEIDASPKKFGFFETYEYDENKKEYANAYIMPSKETKK